MNWNDLLLGNKGRINRKSFLIGLLPIILIFALVALYLRTLSGILPDWANIVVPALFTLEALYFLANLSIKRMHDYGRSAHYLWLLFSPLIFAAGFLIQQKFYHLKSYEGMVVIYTVVISLVVIASLWMLVEMVFLRSDEQNNKYGPAPGNSKP